MGSGNVKYIKNIITVNNMMVFCNSKYIYNLSKYNKN